MEHDTSGNCILNVWFPSNNLPYYTHINHGIVDFIDRLIELRGNVNMKDLVLLNNC